MYCPSNIRRYWNLPACERVWHIAVLSSFVAVGVILNGLFLRLLHLQSSDPNLGYEVISRKWSLLERESEVDMLVLGDSSGDQGFDPEEYFRSTNDKSLNLCTFGDMLIVDDVWMLETYLQNNRPPRCALLVHVYDIWHRSDAELAPLRQIPIQSDDWDQLTELVPLGPIWKFSVWIDRYVPIYSRRETLHFLLFGSGKRAQPLSQTISSTGFRAVHEASPSSVRVDRMNHLENIVSKPFIASELNRRSLNRMMDICDEFGIQLIIANSPLDQTLAKDQAFLFYFSALQDWLRTQTSPRPNCVLIESLFEVHQDELERVDHVTADAAARYTEFLADEIRKLPSASPSSPKK